MKYLIVCLLAAACVTGAPVRLEGPEGPWPLPEEMPEGRKACTKLCATVGREFEEYRYDGKCVCKNEVKDEVKDEVKR